MLSLREHESHLSVLTDSFLSQEPVRKKKGGRGSQRPDMSELTLVPRASLSPHREVSPVLFSHPDQRPSAFASEMVLFGGSEEDL